VEKSPDAFRTISEAAEELDLPQHVLRFWETRFSTIRPLKRGGGRRYYRPEDVQLLKGIRHLLYDQGFTIKGVQRILKEQGAKQVIAIGQGGAVPPAEAGDADADSVPIGLPVALTASDRELLGNVLKELLDCKRLLDRARETA
jgi:DNA-binding transcriptional MerR regulator